jgi:anaerobic dimethyl sulfoxide reductase subunit B (iron-sulfur subunit)
MEKMSKQYGFFVDVTKCSGCRTCVVACKDAHDLPVGMNFRRVLEYTGGEWKQGRDGAWRQNVFGYYVSVACSECEKPACTAVCPTKAHAKRAEDGLVLIDTAKCIGCGACAKACPYGVPQLDEKAHKMRKCDACADRLAKGKQPICVEACPQRALEFGDIAELRAKHSKLAAIAPLPSDALTHPSLVIKAPAYAKAPGDKTGRVAKI